MADSRVANGAQQGRGCRARATPLHAPHQWLNVLPPQQRARLKRRNKTHAIRNTWSLYAALRSLCLAMADSPEIVNRVGQGRGYLYVSTRHGATVTLPLTAESIRYTPN
ncbi:jg4183 [Pararge aegeria aegeria]|uniref:Jg4183 protein n=1 Tax=Pararge aegeria aegeria TaxID=348720 RepID=A0A8S4SCP3_9NEOP|nr:jg4183 [Pararge aegeria aegeria]